MSAKVQKSRLRRVLASFPLQPHLSGLRLRQLLPKAIVPDSAVSLGQAAEPSVTVVLVGSWLKAKLWRQDHPEEKDVVIAWRPEAVEGLNLPHDSRVVYLGDAERPAEVFDALRFAMRV